jgi:hypothetical protein
MCWNAEWNGSEDYEESWNGKIDGHLGKSAAEYCVFVEKN